VQHEPEGIDIARGTDLGGIEPQLFWAHVSHGAQERVLLRRGGEPLGLAADRPADAKVDDLRRARGIDQNVGRLEIPVDDPLTVGVGDPAAGGRKQPDAVAGCKLPVSGEAGEARRLRHELHHDERPPGVGGRLDARGMDLGDGRVPQPAEEFRLVGEPPGQVG